MELINVQTGEVIETAELTDDELVQSLRELEDAYAAARVARDTVRQELIGRMEEDGAKLKLTKHAKVRLQTTTRVGDRRLVDELYEKCPDSLRKTCFKFDMRPVKKGLNELAKLGEDWRKRVDAIYKTSSSLQVEWLEEEESSESVENSEVDIPF